MSPEQPRPVRAKEESQSHAELYEGIDVDCLEEV